jgi:hypothetical protein
LKLEVLKALSGCSAVGVHHEAGEELERRGAEGLGEDVGDHALGGDVVEFGRAGGEVLSDEVVADVDVTHAMASDPWNGGEWRSQAFQAAVDPSGCAT